MVEGRPLLTLGNSKHWRGSASVLSFVLLRFINSTTSYSKRLSLSSQGPFACIAQTVALNSPPSSSSRWPKLRLSQSGSSSLSRFRRDSLHSSEAARSSSVAHPAFLPFPQTLVGSALPLRCFPRLETTEDDVCLHLWQGQYLADRRGSFLCVHDFIHPPPKLTLSSSCLDHYALLDELCTFPTSLQHAPVLTLTCLCYKESTPLAAQSLTGLEYR